MNQKKSKTWLVIVIIVVLATLAYLAYSFRTTLLRSGSESVLNQLQTQSSSDSISDIEKDLNNTSLGGLASEISDINAEL